MRRTPASGVVDVTKKRLVYEGGFKSMTIYSNRKGKRAGKRKGSWVAVLLVLALLAAGCGSSKREDSGAKGDNKAAESATQSALTAGGSTAMSMADQNGSSSVSNSAVPAPGKSSAESDKTGSAKQEAGKVAGALAPASSNGLALANSAGAFDRKIVYKANIAMEVENYGDAQSEIKNKALLAGGYIVQFSENRTPYEQSGTLTVKVPSNGFTGFITALEQMKPKSIQQNIQGQDVTEEFVDLTSRLKSKQVMEARLLDFLGKSTKTDELISFSNELGRVQEEIEKIKGRMTYLEQNVAFSTVEIRLYQKLEGAKKQKEPADSFGGQIKHAASASASVMLEVLQALLLFLAGALPVLTVLAIAGTPVLWWLRKRRRAIDLQEQRAQQLRQENRYMQMPAKNEATSSSSSQSATDASADEPPSV